jgi:sugar lactone lactonase YvrE
VLAACVASDARAQDAEPASVAWTISKGMAQPESAHFDAASGALFISNLAGSPAEKDAKGWITKADGDGKVVAEQWVKGLNAPKGLRSFQGMLWVADIDRVLAIDIKSGEIKRSIAIDGAKFLNDIAVDNDGAAYVSDMHTNTIYQIKGEQASVFAEGEELAHPNGLVVHDDQLAVACWGTGVDPQTFTTKVLGSLLTVDLSSRRVTPVSKRPIGNLDGVELDGNGGYFVTDWMAGKVLRVSSSGETTELLKGISGAADLGVIEAKGLLVIPRMRDNKVSAYRIDEQ